MSVTNSGGRPVFFCYAPQRRAVIEDLFRMGVASPDVRGVDRDGLQMMGIEGGTFVNIPTHSEQPGPRIHEVIQVMGFVLVTLDDTHFRARMCRGQR